MEVYNEGKYTCYIFTDLLVPLVLWYDGEKYRTSRFIVHKAYNKLRDIPLNLLAMGLIEELCSGDYIGLCYEEAEVIPYVELCINWMRDIIIVNWEEKVLPGIAADNSVSYSHDLPGIEENGFVVVKDGEVYVSIDLLPDDKYTGSVFGVQGFDGAIRKTTYTPAEFLEIMRKDLGVMENVLEELKKIMN